MLKGCRALPQAVKRTKVSRANARFLSSGRAAPAVNTALRAATPLARQATVGQSKVLSSVGGGEHIHLSAFLPSSSHAGCSVSSMLTICFSSLPTKFLFFHCYCTQPAPMLLRQQLERDKLDRLLRLLVLS